jgi:hypothetical protein
MRSAAAIGRRSRNTWAGLRHGVRYDARYDPHAANPGAEHAARVD